MTYNGSFEGPLSLASPPGFWPVNCSTWNGLILGSGEVLRTLSPMKTRDTLADVFTAADIARFYHEGWFEWPYTLAPWECESIRAYLQANMEEMP